MKDYTCVRAFYCRCGCDNPPEFALVVVRAADAFGARKKALKTPGFQARRNGDEVAGTLVVYAGKVEVTR